MSDPVRAISPRALNIPLLQKLCTVKGGKNPTELAALAVYSAQPGEGIVIKSIVERGIQTTTRILFKMSVNT